MKYPFSPSVLDALPEELAELYRGLEDTLLEEICSRLRIAGELNEVTVADIKALRSHGIPLDEIKKAIAKTNKISMEKLNKLFDDVVARNQAYYTQLIDLAHVTAPETLVDNAAIYAIYQQTKGELRNITRSMGFLVNNGKTMLPPAKAYQHALDMAVMEVESGAINYKQAISRAVKELAGSGLKVVDFESGVHRQIDSHARTCVMTGVNQINQKYREQSMDYLETDVVETTAHIGARNTGSGYFNHESWQGGRYHWRKYGNKHRGKYPDFEDVCGMGEGGGIGGWNCRHSYWPYLDGIMEPTYSKDDLDSMKAENNKCEFEGKEYNGYEKTQVQRKIERTIRKQKRILTSAEALGNEKDAENAKLRLQQLNRKYREFSKAAGLPEQRDRLRVLYAGDVKPLKKALPKKANYQAKAESALEKMYTARREKFGLTSTSLEEWKKTGLFQSMVLFDGMDEAVQKAVSSQIEELTKKYYSSAQSIRVGDRKESFGAREFASTTQKPVTASSEIVFNPFKVNDVSRIRELSDKGWSVKIAAGDEGKYVITHEFAHSIINLESAKEKNFVGYDTKPEKKAASKIKSIFGKYESEVKTAQNSVKKYEFDVIMGDASAAQKYIEAKKTLDAIKISDYSLASADEFMAECFAQHELGIVKNKYAEEVVEVIKKYFGR